MKRYPIGDVARTLGVTPAGLHYFEKAGVIRPVKGETSRRTYSTVDFIRLVSYKKYRNMEMPLKVIANQFSPAGDDYSVIQERVRSQVEHARERAEFYSQLAEDMAWHETHIAEGIELMGQIGFATMPAGYRVSVGERGCISPEKSDQILISKWLEALPATRISIFSDGSGNGRFGYSMRTSRAEKLGLTAPPAERVGGKTCVRTFTKVSKELYEHPELAFESAWEYMKSHGFVQDGEAAAVILCVHCHEDELDTLLEVYVPFR